jgi:hypothetical protein
VSSVVGCLINLQVYIYSIRMAMPWQVVFLYNNGNELVFLSFTVLFHLPSSRQVCTALLPATEDGPSCAGGVQPTALYDEYVSSMCLTGVVGVLLI